ncbi:MAG: hypothetical protein ACKO2V_25335, partial [Snowella sp.]
MTLSHSRSRLPVAIAFHDLFIQFKFFFYRVKGHKGDRLECRNFPLRFCILQLKSALVQSNC